MRNFILEILAWPRSYALLSWFDREFTRPYIALLQRTTRVLSNGKPPCSDQGQGEMIQFYEEHAASVLRAASTAKREVLVFDPAMSWEPLCKFLNFPTPTCAYPHLNSTQEALELEWKLYWQRWRVVASGVIWKFFFSGMLGAIVALGMTTSKM